MQELDPCRKLTVLKPEGTRRVGEPKLKWLESVERELKNFLRNWMCNPQDREQQRTILEEATVRQGLKRKKKEEEEQDETEIPQSIQ